MLHRVAVKGCETDRGGPLMVLLVDVLVHPLVVEQPVGVVEHDLLHQHADDQLKQDTGKRGQDSVIEEKEYQ